MCAYTGKNAKKKNYGNVLKTQNKLIINLRLNLNKIPFLKFIKNKSRTK